MILANAYHLLLRPARRRSPGRRRHRFMGWKGRAHRLGRLPDLLARPHVCCRRKCALQELRRREPPPALAERSIEVQTAIGSDVMMALDVCPPSTADARVVREAMTAPTAGRCEPGRPREPRAGALRHRAGRPRPGPPAESAGFLSGTRSTASPSAPGGGRHARGARGGGGADRRPPARGPARYLMGVGTPPDLLDGIARGWTSSTASCPPPWPGRGPPSPRPGGPVSPGRAPALRRPARRPLHLPTCASQSRGYLHHLAKCGEPLGPRLPLPPQTAPLPAAHAGRAGSHRAGRFAAFSARRSRRSTGTSTTARRARLAGGPPPRDRSGPGGRPDRDLPDGRHEVVHTRLGVPAVRDRALGEVMHPVIGPAVESERLYVASRGCEHAWPEADLPSYCSTSGSGRSERPGRLARLGGGAAGIAPARDRELRADLAPLSLALSPEASAALGLSGAAAAAARTLLAEGRCATPRTLWRLVPGDALEALAGEAALAEVVFWDPFSPRRTPRCGRWPLLRGPRPIGHSRHALHLQHRHRDALRPAAGWLLRGRRRPERTEGGDHACRDRSGRPPPAARRGLAPPPRALERALPPDAPPDALDRIRGHPQFR